jgi:glycerol-3-phosphate acyltransferase PlsY
VIALAIVAGYLLGTFPSAELITRIATRGNVDIREYGSGNPGTLNAIHAIGNAWGMVVLFLDVAKGVAAGFVGLALAGPAGAYAGATASIAGHIFPVWARFRGGKGVATSAGACLAVFPAYFPINLAVALLSAVRSGRATLGTQIGAAIWILAAAVWWAFDLPNLWGPEPGPGLLIFSVVGSALILWAFAAARRKAAAEPGGALAEESGPTP